MTETVRRIGKGRKVVLSRFAVCPRDRGEHHMDSQYGRAGAARNSGGRMRLWATMANEKFQITLSNPKMLNVGKACDRLDPAEEFLDTHANALAWLDSCMPELSIEKAR